MSTTGQSLVGGISSQFRINPFTGTHLVVKQAHGATITTVDGRTFLDMFMAHGSTVIGHGHPAVLDAIAGILPDGLLIGYESPLAEVVAQKLTSVIPSAEAVRFVVSGSDAVTSAMRLARAHTGRDLVIKIDGHYNGGSDYAMINSLVGNMDVANTGGHASRPIRSSGGIPRVVEETIVPVPWNDLTALAAAFAANPDRIAAVIMVPIDFNNGCLEPTAEYLAAAADLTRANGALVLFDEVLSGFKTGVGGAQAQYGVTPDLTMLSKAMSSGVPLSAIAGKRAIMDTLMKPPPAGAIQGGTYAGNVIGLAAADATLGILSQPDFYPALVARAEGFYAELQAMFDRSPVPAHVAHAGVMFAVYLGTREPVTDYATIRGLDQDLRRRYFSAVIERGVYFHTDFSVSSAHTDEQLAQVLQRMEDAARSLG
ncbi:MAG: aminotransferase class III-fold pyridoxal phosphate-dependent enzyme [Chloroflexota bacterium]